MLHVFSNDEFIPRYPIWILILKHNYMLVNKNKPTHLNGVKNLLNAKSYNSLTQAIA
jgi:hypothetical protein